MQGAITLDQLRTFVAVADEGSFSAAGRKLRRVQSAISHAMANLESQLGVKLWDRTKKVPTLTPQGTAILVAARRICREMDALGEVAEGLAGGLEPTVAFAVDAVVPVGVVVNACREFRTRFPTVQLRLFTETMAAVASLVQGGTADLGVIGPAAQTPSLTREHLMTVHLVPVAAKEHPLAAIAGPIPAKVMASHVNIVFSERATGQPTPDQGVLSADTWRVTDLSVKHALILAGLGWGNMPEHRVAEDLRAGRLVRIRPAEWAEDEWRLSMSVVHRRDLPLGPAARWLAGRLRELCVQVETAPRRKRIHMAIVFVILVAAAASA
jgi:DNA-binding transcriptional LysR family regulator